jgi:cobalt-zinc-cadmium efflux system outer membrane protein
MVTFARSLGPSRFLSLLLLVSPSLIAAAEPLSLTQALALAAERHPALAAQAYAERAASALVEQADVRPAPTLEVDIENVLGTGRLQGVRSLETTVAASQTFERGAKRAKRVAVAGRERDLTAKEFAVRRAEILAAAAAAYVHALAAQQRLTLAAEPLRLARETLALIESRARSGAASAIESARARAAVISAEAEFTRTESAFVSARATLAATWGADLAAVPSSALPGTLLLPSTPPDESALRARLAAHPRVDQQAALIAGRRAALDLAQAQSTADVTASGGVRFLRDGTDAAFVAGLSVPIFSRHQNQGHIRAARETLAGAEHAVAAVASQLRLAFNAAWQDLAAAHTLAQKLRREALPATEAAHAAVRRAYAAGPIPLTDVLDAQRALVDLRREILSAETDYATALVRLEALTDSTFPLTAALVAP